MIWRVGPLGIESRLQSIWLRVNSINLELTLLTRSNCLLPACTVNQPIVFRRGMEKRNRREANGSPTNAKGEKTQRDWKLGIGDRMRGESPTNRARGPKTGLAAIYRGYTGIEFKLEKARTRGSCGNGDRPARVCSLNIAVGTRPSSQP